MKEMWYTKQGRFKISTHNLQSGFKWRIPNFAGENFRDTPFSL